MTRHVKGLIGLIRQVNSSFLFTQCMIHREALASKELSSELLVVMNPIVKIVNAVKAKPKAMPLFKALCREMGASH